MLTTETRLRVEFICDRISKGCEVKFEDIVWLQKLASRNPTVDTWLRQARRAAVQRDQDSDSLDDFCQAMDLGEPDPTDHLVGPQDPVTLAEWFSNRRKWFRGSS